MKSKAITLPDDVWKCIEKETERRKVNETALISEMVYRYCRKIKCDCQSNKER